MIISPEENKMLIEFSEKRPTTYQATRSDYSIIRETLGASHDEAMSMLNALWPFDVGAFFKAFKYLQKWNGVKLK